MFGQLGNRDRELVATIGFVVADVVVKPGVITAICDRDIVIGESGSEPVGILDFSDEAGRRLGRKVVSLFVSWLVSWVVMRLAPERKSSIEASTRLVAERLTQAFCQAMRNEFEGVRP